MIERINSTKVAMAGPETITTSALTFVEGMVVGGKVNAMGETETPDQEALPTRISGIRLANHG